ncbi:carboxy terminal-processing peptidase [Myroides ceti]|uniref:Carboxy terminal-processing peptidase n=1 Tax=Paenimyroides ceti TaxID=395087 RepID=A0ABT8CNL6_9FLAO|nr:carboxy terminal-processing peptidase [Paenimyroides ceti]MDN3705779.1 carboxy terminal-processing peptidase [Paenimyroides ceti]
MNAIWLFMKRNYKIILIVLAISAALWSFMPKKEKADPEKEALLMELLTYVIKNGHYAPSEINNEFSAKVYKEYIKAIDPNKRFLLQTDIDELNQYEFLIDDFILARRFDLFDKSYQILQKRMKESQAIYKEILSQPFDFNVKEEINTDFDKMPFAKDEAALKERWRKQLKLNVLSNIEDKIKLQEGQDVEEESFEEPNEEIKITEKKTVKKEPVEKKSMQELEKEARESTLKSLNEYFEAIEEISRTEWLSIYINSILEQFDPHTSYFAPEDKEKFDVSMSGSMEGIGAQLRKKNDYTEITEIIPGGPAWKGKELENGDVIMKVAQGNEEPVDIAGMRLENVVKMIKGKKNTEVRLTVKKVDGTIKVISIMRDKFELEETYAKSVIIDTKDGKYGMIQLPKFYIDFETKDNRNAFTDVAKEIEYLKQQNVKGIIMDLRNNGGGSLQTVVDMVGLFIEQGPVVQVKSQKGARNVLFDKDQKVQWDGPLVVLINNYSASASEIFAAAIQDYNRGLILGSKHSFGKGTVQNMFDLNSLLKLDNVDLGAIKFTSQKFYRVNGGSTQLKGVESDIVLPDRFSHIDTGERDRENAMPWDKIEKANYKPLANNFKKVIENSNKRVLNNSQFRLIDENAQWISQRKDENVFSLNYNDFTKKSKEIEEKAKKFKALKDYKNSLKFTSLPYEEALFANDSILKRKRDRWHEGLNNDVYVEEAVNVLQEITSKK